MLCHNAGPVTDFSDRFLSKIKSSISKDGVVYRCPTHKGHKVSIREGSFLSNHNISLTDFILLAYLWGFQLPVTAAAEMVGCSSNTAVQWYSYFRDACSFALLRRPHRIGGIGRIVEIDESVIARRKYNRGHRVPERWVFGGIDVETKRGFLVLVDDRSAATLLPLIQRYIEPGSIIHSDQWASYNGIAALNVNPPYVHNVVNHSHNFVDPQTGCTTNHVE